MYFPNSQKIMQTFFARISLSPGIVDIDPMKRISPNPSFNIVGHYMPFLSTNLLLFSTYSLPDFFFPTGIVYIDPMKRIPSFNIFVHYMPFLSTNLFIGH